MDRGKGGSGGNRRVPKSLWQAQGGSHLSEVRRYTLIFQHALTAYLKGKAELPNLGHHQSQTFEEAASTILLLPIEFKNNFLYLKSKRGMEQKRVKRRVVE